MRAIVLQAKSKQEKIAVLRGLSSQKEDYSNYEVERSKFENDWESKNKDIKCEVCDDLMAVCRHHIKPLSQGGLHKDDNVMYLCHYCHAKIHDWIVPIRSWDKNINSDYDFIYKEIVDHDYNMRQLEKNDAPGWEIARERQRMAEIIEKFIESK